MGKSQGAEDSFRGEEGEEADEDEAGEKDEGGGEHGCFKQGLIELVLCGNNRGGEEGDGQCNNAAFVEEDGDYNTNFDMYSEGDEGVELEESKNKGRGCCSPQNMGDKE